MSDTVNSQSQPPVTGTICLSRESIGRGEAPPEKTAAPSPEEVVKMPYSVVSGNSILCAKCSDSFEITPDFYNTATECPGCNCVFVIRPPGTPAYNPGGTAQSTSPDPDSNPAVAGGDTQNKSNISGIQVEKKSAKDYGITGTVLLSRQGMGMTQRKRGQRRSAAQQQPQSEAKAMQPPPAAALTAGMVYSVATENDVGCPTCSERFEISPEFYEQVAECPECETEFVIKPPGTQPYQASSVPVQAHAPAAPVAATESQPIPVNTSQKKMNPLIIGLLGAVVLLLLVLIIVIAVK